MNCAWFPSGLILYFSFISTSYCEEDPLLIGIFNIQIFGKTKSEDPAIMDILVKVRTFYLPRNRFILLLKKIIAADNFFLSLFLLTSSM